MTPLSLPVYLISCCKAWCHVCTGLAFLSETVLDYYMQFIHNSALILQADKHVHWPCLILSAWWWSMTLSFSSETSQPALFNPHFHTIVQLCKKATRGSVPRDLVEILPGQSMPSPQGIVLVGNCCSNGEINTRQSKAATISKSLGSSAFLSRVALTMKCWLLHVAVPWAAPDLAAREFLSGGAGRILFAHRASLRQSRSSHFMHSLILCIVGRGTFSKKTQIQNDQGGLIARGKWQCCGPARQ